MALGEFDLITRFFGQRAGRPGPHVELGIGDDCALLSLGSGMQLAVSADMLVEGRHFLSTVRPERLGHKALAVNLSDLAASGARPVAFLLALSMPRVDEAFLDGFSRGMLELAQVHGCTLVGGDTTQGPLNIAITVMGEVPSGQALLRSGARAGDEIYVSGELGDARLALEAFRGTHVLEGSSLEHARRAMELPVPRVALGIALRGVATAAIDVSDGLLGDLRHILRRSGVGATVDADVLPRSRVLAAQPRDLQRLCTLSGGDDYELVFTVPPARRADLERAAAQAGVAVTRIGRIEAEPGLRLRDADGQPLEDHYGSFDHFRESRAEGDGGADSAARNAEASR